MGIEIHQEDRPGAEALATKVLACKRDIRQALGWATGQRHQPQLHYGPQFDAETSDLDTHRASGDGDSEPAKKKQRKRTTKRTAKTTRDQRKSRVHK